MSERSHFDLRMWREAKSLAVEIYEISALFPRSEQFGLISQMRRAAISVPTNIAEGTGRRTPKDMRSFLSIARGSAHEMASHVDLAAALHFVDEKKAAALIYRYKGLAAGIFRYMQRIKTSPK